MAPAINLLAPKLPVPRFKLGDLVEHRANGERAVVVEHLTDIAAEHQPRRDGRIDWPSATGQRYGRRVYLRRIAVAPTFSDGTATLKCVYEHEVKLVERERDASRPVRAVDRATIRDVFERRYSGAS